VRGIDQIFEIRANSELEQSKKEILRRVFISHGRSDDWRKVQPFIEKDIELETIELAQEPNAGQTIIEQGKGVRSFNATFIFIGITIKII